MTYKRRKNTDINEVIYLVKDPKTGLYREASEAEKIGTTKTGGHRKKRDKQKTQKKRKHKKRKSRGGGNLVQASEEEKIRKKTKERTFKKRMGSEVNMPVLLVGNISAGPPQAQENAPEKVAPQASEKAPQTKPEKAPALSIAEEEKLEELAENKMEENMEKQLETIENLMPNALPTNALPPVVKAMPIKRTSAARPKAATVVAPAVVGAAPAPVSEQVSEQAQQVSEQAQQVSEQAQQAQQAVTAANPVINLDTPTSETSDDDLSPDTVPLDENTMESSKESNAPLLDLNNAMATTSSDDEPNEYSMASASNTNYDKATNRPPEDYVEADPSEGPFETVAPSSNQAAEIVAGPLELENPPLSSSSDPTINIQQAPLSNPLGINPSLIPARENGPERSSAIEIPVGNVSQMARGFQDAVAARQNIQPKTGNVDALAELRAARERPNVLEGTVATARANDIIRNTQFTPQGGKKKTIRKKKKKTTFKTALLKKCRKTLKKQALLKKCRKTLKKQALLKKCRKTLKNNL